MTPHREPPMTEGEKDAIRAKPCSLCLDIPPFPDGSRCHPHRIVRGRDGGQYVGSNVIPLCPPCHRAVDRLVLITAALKGGRARGQTLDRAHQAAAGHRGGARTAQLHPEKGRLLGLKHGHRGYHAGLGQATAAQRSEWGRKGILNGNRMHPEMMAERGRRAIAKRTFEQLSAAGKKGGAALRGPAKSASAKKGWITRRARMAT